MKMTIEMELLEGDEEAVKTAIAFKTVLDQHFKVLRAPRMYEQGAVSDSAFGAEAGSWAVLRGWTLEGGKK